MTVVNGWTRRLEELEQEVATIRALDEPKEG